MYIGIYFLVNNFVLKNPYSTNILQKHIKLKFDSAVRYLKKKKKSLFIT